MTTSYLTKHPYISLYLQHKSEKLDPNKLIGGKATQLRNIDSDLVPDWVVITADCPDDKLPLVVETASAMCRWEIPTSISKYGYYAVRSSAIAEDGEEQSYAGVFESKLNVPITGLEHAVREVRLSGLADRVSAYTSLDTLAQRIKETIPAVIIMPMVNAKYSGVLFTQEPLGGTNQMLVEYESGVGGVVDGTSDTEMLFIDRENISKHVFNESINTPHQQINWGLPKILCEAKRLENNYGKPLDIEWAIDKEGEPFMLQVRPITA